MYDIFHGKKKKKGKKFMPTSVCKYAENRIDIREIRDLDRSNVGERKSIVVTMRKIIRACSH